MNSVQFGRRVLRIKACEEKSLLMWGRKKVLLLLFGFPPSLLGYILSDRLEMNDWNERGPEVGPFKCAAL